MRIHGLKAAVGEYLRANVEGYYSPKYGYLMYNMDSGELWVDEYYSVGRTSRKIYQSKSIVNIGEMMIDKGIDVSMRGVRDFIANEFEQKKKAE